MLHATRTPHPLIDLVLLGIPTFRASVLGGFMFRSIGRRADFAPEEMVVGNDLCFFQDDDGPGGGAVYRMQLREVAPDRLVLETENVSAIKLLLVPSLIWVPQAAQNPRRAPARRRRWSACRPGTPPGIPRTWPRRPRARR